MSLLLILRLQQCHYNKMQGNRPLSPQWEIMNHVPLACLIKNYCIAKHLTLRCRYMHFITDVLIKEVGSYGASMSCKLTIARAKYC